MKMVKDFLSLAFRISYRHPAEERAEILAAVLACMPKDEAGIFVAERMLEMNRSKQQEIGAFWTGWRASWGQRWKTKTPRLSCKGTMA